MLKKVTEGHLGRRAEAEGESGSEALAGDLDVVSVDDIGVLGHGVYAQRHRGKSGWLISAVPRKKGPLPALNVPS
ncbi:MAG TPA: hypothetical protein VLD83_17300 [Candidatus Binatia bacterium]|nr:hypothetical protein [Candidatus Binatia bacterium]